MKVVFLDFDGVLNRGFGRAEPRLADRLNTITHKSGAVIVVHSSWRYGRSLDMLRHILEGWGVKGEVIDMTPVPEGAKPTGGGYITIPDASMQAFLDALPEEFKDSASTNKWHYERPCSIQMWLDAHPGEVESFVILDDHAGFAHLHRNHVHTRMNEGLTDAHVRQALRLLDG
jgi:hypothetical protein